MKSFLRLFINDPDALKIEKSASGGGLWTVKKGFHVLYIGSKEKCKIYMNQGRALPISIR